MPQLRARWALSWRRNTLPRPPRASVSRSRAVHCNSTSTTLASRNRRDVRIEESWLMVRPNRWLVEPESTTEMIQPGAPGSRPFFWTLTWERNTQSPPPRACVSRSRAVHCDSTSTTPTSHGVPDVSQKRRDMGSQRSLSLWNPTQSRRARLSGPPGSHRGRGRNP